MPEMKSVDVKELALDLRNFRTVPQKTEIDAVEAMISTSPDRFWALTESLLQDGYLPTENIIALRSGSKSTALTVREGNRRIAVLKLVHGILSTKNLSLPAEVLAKIAAVTAKWRGANRKVPCTVYSAEEAATVDRIVTLAHGKGDKASRDQWNAVARARHNRDVGKGREPALDLLEKYLKHGQNHTEHQRGRWAGDYPVSVLEEAMKKVAPRLGLPSAPALAKAYPATGYRQELEAILHDIGLQTLRFDQIRSKEADFGGQYGIPPAGKGTDGKPGSKSEDTGATGGGTGAGGTASDGKGGGKAKPRALAIGDAKDVKRTLKLFTPAGANRQKVVTLKLEAQRLELAKTPLAFTFLLRSMFEVSAKAYCADHAAAGGPALKRQDGGDRSLADVLRDITVHLTNNKTDKEMVKALHGAMTELGKQEGMLSVTSMNQLVHNTKFSITPHDVATRFGNVFPLLQAMNQ
ncbi:MAG: hypothetical protein WBD22_11490 [Pyrinomonadaceae bacterium]